MKIVSEVIIRPLPLQSHQSCKYLVYVLQNNDEQGIAHRTLTKQIKQNIMARTKEDSWQHPAPHCMNRSTN